MKQIIKTACLRFLAGICLVLGVCASRGMTVAELRQSMADGKSLTVIDVRSTDLYRAGHIEGAINVPASLLPEKKLPVLGKVIVCGEGLGRDNVDEAVSCLNRKIGIQAESLAGGFAAWETAQGGSTRPMGLQPENLVRITYDQLKMTTMSDVVLVDLRHDNVVSRQGVNSSTNVSQTSLTDLGKEFPRVRIAPSPFSIPLVKQSAAERRDSAPLLVLIDMGNGIGVAETAARDLKANGYHRVVILAGGEQTLARQGQPGLQRRGLGSVITGGGDQ